MKLTQVVSVLTAERDTAAKRVAQLDAAIGALRNGTAPKARVKRVMSHAAIERIRAAQKKRWAKYKRDKKRARG
jgi:hypothetical protein